MKKNQGPEDLTDDGEKHVGRFNDAQGFSNKHPDLEEEVEILNEGGELIWNHPEEAM